jgi:nicotinate-nucleotide adenylyltransferase
LIKRGSALFGGSFDPPHLGHKKIVQETLKLKDVGKVIIVPTFLNPFKDNSFLPPEKRLELLKKMFKDQKNVIIEDFEIRQKRKVYTIETLRALKKRYNIKYIVIGADNLKSITKWKEFEELNSNFSWIVATRDKNSLENLNLLRDYRVIKVDIPISSTQIRSQKGLKFIDPKILEEIEKFYFKEKS